MTVPRGGDVGPRLLDDTRYQRFLVDGYIEIRPETLGAEDHDLLYRRAGDLYALTRATRSPTAHLDHLGDNLRARIPELDALLADPAVDGALTSILGNGYLTHPHSFCHRSSAADQVFHQDGNLPWNERGHARGHRPDWALLFYYPQDVDESNGPTEVVAGSHYWTIDHETADGGWHPGDRIDRTVDDGVMAGDDLDRRDRRQTEALDRGLGIPGLDRRFLHVAAGTVVIAHYDLVHRGSRTAGSPDPRYLYKFYFARVHAPDGPSWSNVVDRPDLTGVEESRRPVIDAIWRWSRGGGVPEGGTAIDVARSRADLLHGREDERVAAAYRLGGHVAAGRSSASDGHAAEAVNALESGLMAGDEAARRAAAHGLRLAGSAGVDALLRGLHADAAPIRRASAAGLSSPSNATSPRVVDALIAVLHRDADDLVRSNAAYALGHLSRSIDADAGRIVDALLERLAPGVEPDNAFSVGLSRSTVRQSAAYGVVQALANHHLDDDRLDRIVDGPLRDGDRYVQGLVIEGLARTDHLADGTRRRLLRYLAGRRWSPTPPPVDPDRGRATASVRPR